MIDFELRLENETLLLRPLEGQDLPGLMNLTSEPDLWRFYTHDLSTLESLIAWSKPAFEKQRLQFIIIDKGNGLPMGCTAFGNISERDKRLEIGWTWLGKAYQGKGINNQVKRLMLSHCFDILELERVEFKTDVLNIQARNSLKNIGAIEEGVLRSHTLMTKERRRDTIYYSILKSEWNYVKRENDW
ncbi:Protein N-acetyltransferase, RimJ/RimL family [Aquiflexum balticum DSM 16537]|uniref:Protein N-acetyltransferase, RimJ/RimL family n=1 Tax=Aquiflexum balticum DSM 16537 TaxID=758820 RepID=A0A1W2H8K5_9BACT|nr:GNAT family protein [Aquiflexum balticum]SMD45207.1 Protein N-acetyltransferase, RimJ/RimL family [Aquiflexum balticum DSM 16537]